MTGQIVCAALFGASRGSYPHDVVQSNLLAGQMYDRRNGRYNYSRYVSMRKHFYTPQAVLQLLNMSIDLSLINDLFPSIGI